MALILDKFIEENFICETESVSCNYQRENLEKELSDQQKKLFRGYVDEKNTLIAQAARENYLRGLSDGLELASAIYQSNKQ